MFLSLIAFLFSYPAFAREIKSFIFVSENTPSDLLSEFSFLSSASSRIPVLRFSTSVLSMARSSHAIFDFTYSLVYRTSLRRFAIDNRILFFSSRESFDLNSEWEFLLHPPPSTEARAIRSLLEFLEWRDFHLLTSESERSRSIYSILSSSPYELISNSADQEVFDLYASRVIKSSGNWKVVVISEHTGASNVLRSIEKSRFFKERCGFVVSSKGWKGSKKLGTIGIVEEGLEDADSEAEYEFKSIERAIKILSDLTEDSEGSVISNDILAKRLRDKNGNNVIWETYSILNFKEESRVVGKIEKEGVETWEEIVFPGNVTYMNNSPPKVLLSANTGAVTQDPFLIYGVSLASSGLQPMVSLVNKDPNILPNFELELHETDCGYYIFEYDYASSCMKKHYNTIGLAHIASASQTVIKPYLNLFREEGIKVPQITSAYNDQTLYNKDLYPEMLVTIPNHVYYYTMLAYLIAGLRWRNIIAIRDDIFDSNVYSVFAENANILNINILNPEDKMIIPYRRTETYYEDVKPILKFIRESNCRIVLFFTVDNSHIFFIEALYDYGYRRGELVLIFIDRVSHMLENSEQSNVDRDKILALTSGSLSTSFDEYVGEYGEQLQKQIADIIHPFTTSYSCYRIEGLMLAVRTVDLMIKSGNDYEDYDDLMRFMRGIRFTGCTGKVSIDSGSNGLSDIVYTIANFYEKEGKEIEERVGSYTFGTTVPLNITKPIIWPTGTTKVPSDLIEQTKCGFADTLIKANTSSRKLSEVLTCSLFLAIFILAGLAVRRLNRPQIDFLEEKKEIMFEDGVLVYLPLIETAQFIGLGPDFYKANFALAFVSSLATLDIERMVEFEFGAFWEILEACIVTTGLWCFCLFFTLSFPDCSTPRLFTDFFEVLGLKMIQVFSGAGFVGINFILFRIFKCPNGIGEELSRSFLYNDCKTFCWEGSHLHFMIVICVEIAIFNVFALVSRPTYDGMMDYVRVKMFYLYAFGKGVFQLALVIVNLHLKDEYPELFSVVYFVMFSVWLFFVFRVDLYNYKRLNSWVRVLGSGVWAHLIVMMGYTFLGVPDIAVFVLQLLIIGGCTGTGLYFQVKKFPSMLYRRKGRNFDKLLRFALTRRVKAKDLTEHELDYVDKRD